MQQADPANRAVPGVRSLLVGAIALIVWLVFALVPPGSRDVLLVFLFLALLTGAIVFCLVARRTEPDSPPDNAARLMNEGDDNARASLDSSAPNEPR